ncbi:Sodium channel protein para (Protein paralytic) (Sodium channel 1) (DmNav1) [Durusdinium trenchii]|uniref:Sodium channel protein para (Protein paralytic) (Sodium channel 1) (DmNav1) n=1 Tax=Durusdinium trenchii TaxID=1381693 RepID=A0ABP0HJZ5_9DINO
MQTLGLRPKGWARRSPTWRCPRHRCLKPCSGVAGSSDADGEAAKPAVAKLKRDGSASAQSLVSSILESIDDEDVSGDLLPNDPKWLERTRHLFMGPRFEFSVCLLLVVNLILMAVQLQFHGMGVGHSIGYSRFDANPKELYPFAEDFFYYADLIFAIIFTLEMMIRWFVIRWDFWRHCLNWIDFLVVVSSWVELFAAALPISPTFLRMMRLGKLLRALRVVRLSQVLESLQLLLKCIVASLRILFWSLVLLMIIQCSAGMTISYMSLGSEHRSKGDFSCTV